MRHVIVRNLTKENTIGTHIEIADTFLSRLVGLLGRRKLTAGGGLLIRPSSGVHTLFMMFSIDVLALDRDLRVIRVWPKLAPFRATRISLTVSSMLELAAGQIEHCRIEPGDVLELS